jgi:hypothetical protein
MAGDDATSPVLVTHPDGSEAGNALEIYYQVGPSHTPQYWVFLTNGFWRQVAPGSEFLTSYRLFRYFSSDDLPQETCTATDFQVVEVTANNHLRLQLSYTNNSGAGDAFDITAEFVLAPPTAENTSMTAALAIQNVSGRDVVPCCSGFHNDLREQWRVVGISSMYVADNLTDAFPSWYDTLDPLHRYVGNLSNGDYLDDGLSLNTPGLRVSTHDAKHFAFADTTISLSHDLPHVVLPGYTWFKQLVGKDIESPVLGVRHHYDPRRNQRVEVLTAKGTAREATQPRWSITYNRDDGNMVDGDNVQAYLALDTALATWPDEHVEEVTLRLTSGPFEPVPDIQANGSDAAIVLQTGDSLSLTVSLAANDATGTAADWWCLARVDRSWYSYVPSEGGWIRGMTAAAQAPISELPARSVFQGSGLSPGVYTVYFGIDNSADGVVNGDLWYDSVVVTVTDE